MLVLSRKPGEGIRVGEVLVRVLNVKGNKVFLGFDGPDGVRVVREELIEIELESPQRELQAA